jgi:hypothetical protein
MLANANHTTSINGKHWLVNGRVALLSTSFAPSCWLGLWDTLGVVRQHQHLRRIDVPYLDEDYPLGRAVDRQG